MEQRKAEHTILLRNKRKTIKVELFPATRWPDQPGAREGLFRMRVDRKWHSPCGKYSFLPWPAILDACRALLTGDADCSGIQEPDIQQGTAVKARNGHRLAGQDMREITRTATPCFRGADGRKHTFILLYGKGLVQVPVSELEVV